MWPTKMRFSSAGSCATWKILHSPAVTSAGTSTFGYLHLLDLRLLNLTKTLLSPSSQSDRAVYISSGWTVSPLLGVQVWVRHSWCRTHRAFRPLHWRWVVQLHKPHHSMSHADYVWSCTPGPQSPTVKPTIALQTPVPVTSRNKRPGYRPPAQYIKVSSFLKRLQKKGLHLNFKLV